MPIDRIKRLGADDRPVGESEPSVVVVGGEAAKGLASQLAEERDVALVSDDEEVVRTAVRADIDARQADITSGSELASEVAGVEVAIVAAERDRVSLLAAQLLRTVCDAGNVALLLNDPTNREFFGGMDVEFLDDRRVLGREIERSLFGEPT